MLPSEQRTRPVVLPPAPPAEPVTFYRWQDENGVSVLSNAQPPPGVAYTTATMDGVLTVMEPPKPVVRPAEAAGNETVNPLSVYTPGGMQQLMQQAKQAKKMVEQSQENTRRQLEGQQ
jgi:hypothetical protein